MFETFHLGTYGPFVELGRHVKRDRLQECLNCGPCKESCEHGILTTYMYHTCMITETIF